TRRCMRRQRRRAASTNCRPTTTPISFRRSTRPWRRASKPWSSPLGPGSRRQQVDLMKTLLLVVDLAGTFVFALSGALAAVERRLDIFGVLVLSFAAASFGGIARDVLIGAIPPASISDWRYLGVSLLAGLITFCGHQSVARWRSSVLVFDGAGLAFFAVSGAQKAIHFGLGPAMAALLGMLTGIGGGMTRDVLLA